jgi:hypothetical protein
MDMHSLSEQSIQQGLRVEDGVRAIFARKNIVSAAGEDNLPVYEMNLMLNVSSFHFICILL